MKFNADEIFDSFKSFDNAGKEDELFNSRMFMYRFLSEVERITDERNISRKELAKMLKTSPSYITQLYRGNKLINITLLAKIEKALGVEFSVRIEDQDTKMVKDLQRFVNAFHKQTLESNILNRYKRVLQPIHSFRQRDFDQPIKQEGVLKIVA